MNVRYTLVALALLCGCTADTGGAPGPTPSAVPTTRSSPDAPTALARDAACDRFVAIVSDFTMTDEQSAAAFAALARATSDAALRAAIQRVANGFAANDPSVSSAEVQALCM